MVAAPDGRPWRIDTAHPDDGPAPAALFAACSPERVRLRFFGQPRALPRDYLDSLPALLAGCPETHDAVVAHRGGARSRPAGLAGLAAVPDAEPPGTGRLLTRPGRSDRRL